eukprot:15435455-Alexandrium_andersonii.AAC.1
MTCVAQAVHEYCASVVALSRPRQVRRWWGTGVVHARLRDAKHGVRVGLEQLWHKYCASVAP